MSKLPENPEFVELIDSELDMFEKDFAGLPKWKNMDCPQYFYMNISDLAKKSPDELNEAIFMLNQYAMNIQRLINKLRAWERWCNSKLDDLEATNIPNISGHYGFNERIKLARNGTEAGKKINEYLRKIRMQLDRIYGIPDQVKMMSDSIRDVKFMAIRKEKEWNRGTE